MCIGVSLGMSVSSGNRDQLFKKREYIFLYRRIGILIYRNPACRMRHIHNQYTR